MRRRLISLLAVLGFLPALAAPAAPIAREDTCVCCVDECHCPHGQAGAAAARSRMPTLRAPSCPDRCERTTVGPRVSASLAVPGATAAAALAETPFRPGAVLAAHATRSFALPDGRGPPLRMISSRSHHSQD